MLLNVEKETRKFVLTTVGACVAIWGVAFELGVWGEVFYSRLFNIWVISLAVVLAIWFLPGRQVPVNWWGRLVIAFPTVWLLLTFVNEQVIQLATIDLIVYFVGLFISVLCLPYLIYVLVSLIDAEPLSLEPRLFISMVVIVIIVGIVGYGVGSNHQIFLNCHDFAIAGEYVPANCTDR
jgi:hypothetical protein